jgi:catechol 2,3-dioxygenase-like lactoylglutathione lyase family enzyme
MRRLLPLCLFSAIALLAAAPASAQLVAAKDGPIVYGHHHVNASNVDEHKKFWIDALGGTMVIVGPEKREVIKFHNALLLLRAQKPTGGTKGTTVNHIGFSVPDLRATVDKVKAAGYEMITRSEVAATQEVKDDIAATAGGGGIAFVMGPDDVKVELVQVRTQTQPIALHHVHFFGQQNAEMRAWYEKIFGGKPRQGGAFLVADLPGVALNFTQSPEATVGTSGRAMDHIGFEVRGLEAFTKSLEAQGIKLTVPYRSVPALNLSIAFINDPWGTSIELTEGLDKVQ